MKTKTGVSIMKTSWFLTATISLLVPGRAFAQDPTAAGPFSVLTATYDRGDEAFSCVPEPGCEISDPTEIRAEVYYPSNLAAGPFPLLVFLHGRHTSCYDPATGDATNNYWPCSEANAPLGGSFVPIPSYRGYDYIGRILASHGYIVASISANGINALDEAFPPPAFNGIPDRAHLVDAHLQLWGEFNSVGSAVDPAPFASDFIGAVDLTRVGTMGHSRGGDGVVNHASIFQATTNYELLATLPIAPTNFLDTTVNELDLGVLLGYCDGDVISLPGVQFFDRSRYNVPGDESTKYTFLSLGSNHNFFNTAWTPECWLTPGLCWSDDRGTMPGFGATGDDFPGTFGFFGVSTDPFCSPPPSGAGRLPPATQRLTGLAYNAAFFRFHVGGEVAFGPLLRGDVAPPATPADDTFVAYHAPASRRLDLNRLADVDELSETTLVGTGGLRGAVIDDDLTTYERCGFDTGTPCFPGAVREAHLDNPGLSRLRTAWDEATDSFVNELPAGARDVSEFEIFQFRVGVDYTDPDNAIAPPVEFSITFNGATSSATVNSVAQLGNDDLYFPPGTTQVKTAVMNSVRLPLDLFAGVNLADVHSITLQFDETPDGTILLSDLAFSDDENEVAQPGCQASESFLVGDRATVTTPDDTSAVNNSGSGITRVGHDALTETVLSVGAVDIRDRATVNGDITSEGSITVSSSATVTGTQTPFGTVDLPAPPSLPAFPPPSGGNLFVNPGPPVTLAPGSRPAVTVNSGGTLILQAGDYFFQSLTVNSAATIQVTPDTRVFVQNSLALRAPFRAAGGAVQPILLGFAGNDVTLESTFDGTLIAPNARVTFGIGSGLVFTGSFFARIIEVRPDSDLVCLAFSSEP
jgi:hypothetical protein